MSRNVHAPARSFSSAAAWSAPLEGFHHAWATVIAQQLNQQTLPPGYFAESESSVGPELEIDVVTLELARPVRRRETLSHQEWAPSRPKITVKTEFAQLDSYEIRVYQELGGAGLRAAIELVSPANKDRAGSRRTFAAKCAGYLQHGLVLVIVDIVTSCSTNLHQGLFNVFEVKGRRPVWHSPTGLYAIAYRAVTVRQAPRLEVWPEPLTLGKELPILPLWLWHDLYVTLRLENSYLTTCHSLRISA
jgi:hypothetical protein